MTTDILCLGEPMLEFNQQPDGRYLAGHGGDTSNCAVSAARAGATVGMITRIGNDIAGTSFLDLWTAEGVRTEFVDIDSKAHTGVYFVTHDTNGHNFSYLRARSAASLMQPENIPLQPIKDAKILHVSGISQAISESAADSVFTAISQAKAAGTLISYDTNLRLKLWPLARARAIIHAATKSADIVLPGLDDARQLTGLDTPGQICDFYLAQGARIVAITLGAAGTLVATAEKQVLVDGFKVDAIDATAAGDTFDGAFLAEYLRSNDPFQSARFANAAAALSTQGYGAVAPMPTRDAIEQFMKGHSS